MRSIRTLVVAISMLALDLPMIAMAGSPHFVSCTPSVQGNQACVTGKEAGLGDESQVHVVVTVVAHCQNPGGNDPSAQNKETFGAAFDEPAQNGKALYEACVTTAFSPSCS